MFWRTERFLWFIIGQEEKNLLTVVCITKVRTPGQFIEHYSRHISHLVFALCRGLCVCVCVHAAVSVYRTCKVGLFHLGAYLLILFNVLNSGQDECVRAYTSEVGNTCLAMSWTCFLVCVSPFRRKRKSTTTISSIVNVSIQPCVLHQRDLQCLTWFSTNSEHSNQVCQHGVRTLPSAAASTLDSAYRAFII